MMRTRHRVGIDNYGLFPLGLTPLGTLQNAKQQITLVADTQLNNAQQFSQLIIATHNGRNPKR